MRISDWSSDVCSSDLALKAMAERAGWSQNLAHVHPDNYVRTLKRRLCETIFARLRAAGCGKDRSLVDLAADLTGVAGAPILWTERELDVVARALGDELARIGGGSADRSEEHTSELQSLMRISYAV